MDKHYVTMVDEFMSGWGDAENRTNIYMVVCDTIDQAEQIVKAGKARDEMRRVKYRGTHKPHYDGRQYLVTEKQFNELGPIWTGEQE